MISRSAISSGVTAHKISKSITFYWNQATAARPAPHLQTDTKPLLLLLPWLGSKPHTVAKYCEIYFRTGFDVLMVESEVKQFLWPRWGLDHGAEVLRVLESERFAARPLLVHAFSIGGYTFSQLLVHMAGDPQRHGGLIGRIKGQVYDSLVIGSLDRMAVGLSKNLFPRWEQAVKHTSLLYFRAFRRQTVDYFDTAIGIFQETPVTAPALFFFCEDDSLCDVARTEEVIAHWRGRGITVEAKGWKESTHAGHLRRHPSEYLATLETFIHSLHLWPLRAKM